MSTPTGSIVTGSNYLVDINFLPNALTNTIYLNSELSGSVIPNGSGSLTATSSLFISNRNSGSSVGTPLEIFNTKLYTPRLVAGMIRQNYNSLSTRLGLSQKLSLPIVEEGLLNFYPGAAAAYSLRSLNSDYGGAAIQVRRSSDNAVANIGFTSNGDLDTIALLAHCGSGNGFVTTWYDQSGNANNATQTTAANQPQIVSSGSVLTLTGTGSANPCMRFDGVDDRFDLTSTIPVSAGDKYSIFQVEKKTSSGAIGIWITGGSNTSDALFGPIHYSNANLFINTKFLASTSDFQNGPLSGNNYNLISGYNKDSNTLSAAFVNNSAFTITSGVLSAPRVNQFSRIGARTAEFSNTSTQEMIIYLSDESANNTAINTNINSFYGIY